MKHIPLKQAYAFSLSIALLFSQQAAAGSESGHDILIQAHGGTTESPAPENTLSAFRKVIESGADGFETDVRMTKDGHLVIHHDDSVDNTSNGTGLISEMTLDELKALDFGSWFGPEYAGEKILTLEECIEEAKEMDIGILNLELKPERAEEDSISADLSAYVKLAADTIIQSGFSDHILVTSFDSDILSEVKEYAPDIRIGIITIPDLTVIRMLNLSMCLPKDKPLEDYEAEDLKNLPEMFFKIMKNFGVRGDDPDDALLELIHSVAAVVPPGTTYPEFEILAEKEADVIGYVKSLDFPVDYVNCHYNTLTEELIESMHAENISVMTWTPDTETDLKKVIALSPDVIVTDMPETALSLMN